MTKPQVGSHNLPLDIINATHQYVSDMVIIPVWCKLMFGVEMILKIGQHGMTNYLLIMQLIEDLNPSEWPLNKDWVTFQFKFGKRVFVAVLLTHHKIHDIKSRRPYLEANGSCI